MIRPRLLPRIRQGHLGLKILALFLSIFMWGFVRFTQTPFASTLSQAEVSVKPQLMHDADMEVIGAPETVSVTVRGSEESIRALRANSIAAVIDLRGKAEGKLFPPISVSPPPDLTVVSLSPEVASVRLVPIVSQSFPVEPRIAGHVAHGYEASPPTLRTPTATVIGGRDFVNQVKHVVASISLNNTETGLMQRVLLEPLDEGQNPVGNVRLEPDSEIVTVNVTPAVVPRILPIFPQITGNLPASLTMDVSWTPRVVPIVFTQAQGTPATLNSDPIDVSSMGKGEHRVAVAVVVPPQGTLIKDKVIQVTIRVRTAKKKKARSKKPVR